MLAHTYTLKLIRRLHIFLKRLHTLECRAFSRCSTNVIFLGLSAARFYPSKQILKYDFLLSPPESDNASMSFRQVPWHLIWIEFEAASLKGNWKWGAGAWDEKENRLGSHLYTADSWCYESSWGFWRTKWLRMIP